MDSIQSIVRSADLAGHIDGYPATVAPQVATAFSSIDESYAEGQTVDNIRKTDDYLVPLLKRLGAKRVLDAGCGVGATVERLVEHGFDAHGFDLLENVKYWKRLGRPVDRYVVSAAVDPVLPYADGTFDALYSFGVIEHVGTNDGNATRLPDYHDIRRRWTQELMRVVRPGGSLLLAGPNRQFPIDTAHGWDAEALPLEKTISRLAKVTVHRPWGPNFLWGYPDVERYVAGQDCRIEGLTVDGLMFFSRVPWPFRTMAQAYVRHLPKGLLKSPFNPWVAALITKAPAG